MSHYIVSEYEHTKSRKVKKVLNQSIPRVPNFIRSKVSLLNNAKTVEHAKENINMRLLPYPKRSTAEEADQNVPSWHNFLSLTFESFLLKLDEIFTELAKEELYKASESSPVISCYKNVCERLRLEILIAIDKLELVSSSKNNCSERETEFLQKMGELKILLSNVRLQYHKAVKEFGSKMN